MAGIEFHNYHLNEISYIRNDNFDPSDGTITLDIKPIVDLKYNDKSKEDKALVNFDLILGSLEDPKAAFQVVLKMTAHFSYNKDESDGRSFEQYLLENATAILYSYMRPMVSDIIMRANEFPNYILPVLNVTALLEEENKE